MFFIIPDSAWCDNANWITWREDLPGRDWSQEPGFEAWRHAEYAINDEDSVRQPEAAAECGRCGATLLSVTNAHENQFITAGL